VKWREADEPIITSTFPQRLDHGAQVRDTILHEIAHALAGPRTGHREVWQATAKAIGCSSMRCYGDEVIQPAAKFKGICPGCRKTILRMRRVRITGGAWELPLPPCTELHKNASKLAAILHFL
jgi:hypothetical protein